jgi:uncharacterized protein (DUF1919 family)
MLFRNLLVLIRRKYRFYFKNRFIKKDLETLKDTNFIIVSNNCWGGLIYKWLNKPYNTPFVNIGIKGDCYLKILSDFDYYMSLPLQFVTESKYPDRKITYPLALLNDVEIHFTHYKTVKEAKDKWERRKARMLKVTDEKKYFFKICNSWDCDLKHFKAFYQLPLKNKISFTPNNYSQFNFENNIRIKEKNKKDKNNMLDGGRLFKFTFVYLNVFEWIENNSKRTKS